MACLIGVLGCGDGAAALGGSTSDGADASGSTSPPDIETSGSTGDPGSSTGSSTGTGTGSDTDDTSAPVECTETDCSASCRAPLEDELDPTCECVSSPSAEWVQSCELPVGCGDFECVVQSLRYGVVGRYGHVTSETDAGGASQTIRVFGPGLASASKRRWEYCCAQTNSSSYGTDYRVQQVRPPDDPFWDECLAEGVFDPMRAPDCLDPDKFFIGSSCEVEGEQCPEPAAVPGPDAGCEASCPMAGDGVCDEVRLGTGLCAAGCDPQDCAAEPK